MRDFNLVIFEREDGSISAIQRRIFETYSGKYKVLGDIPLELGDLETLDFLDSLSVGKSEAVNALLKKIIQGSVRIGRELKEE